MSAVDDMAALSAAYERLATIARDVLDGAHLIVVAERLDAARLLYNAIDAGQSYDPAAVTAAVAAANATGVEP